MPVLQPEMWQGHAKMLLVSCKWGKRVLGAFETTLAGAFMADGCPLYLNMGFLVLLFIS